MKKVRFNLQAPSATQSKVYLVFRWQGNRLLYNTPFTLPPGQWDKKSQRVKPKSSLAPYINPILDKLAAVTLEYYYQCIYTGQEPTHEGFKDRLNTITKKKERKPTAKPVTPTAFFTEWIEQRRQNPKYSPNTISSYESTLKKLARYEALKEPLTWTNVGDDFAIDFAVFLQDHESMSRNTADKYLSNLKTCFTDAQARGYTPTGIKYSVGASESENVYLTRDELRALEALELDTDVKRIARDRFLIGCYTGLRVSDYGQVQEHHFTRRDGVEFIEYSTQKSGKEIKVMIPIHPAVTLVFERLKQYPLTTVNRWTVSNYVKEFARLAGIDTTVTLVRNQKGKNVELSAPKWRFVSSHTARRTFITNALLAGVSQTDIMAVTGIKKIQTLIKYNKLEKEKSALNVANSDFFKS